MNSYEVVLSRHYIDFFQTRLIRAFKVKLTNKKKITYIRLFPSDLITVAFRRISRRVFNAGGLMRCKSTQAAKSGTDYFPSISCSIPIIPYREQYIYRVVRVR